MRELFSAWMLLLGSLKRQRILLLCINSSHLIVLLFWLWLLVYKQDAFCTSYLVSILLVIYLVSSLRFLLFFPKAIVNRICPKNIDESTKLCPFIENGHRVLSSQNTHGSLLLWKSIRLMFLSVNLRGILLSDLISQIAPISCPLAKMIADL